jgi:uncharacterized membrane protein required for colicin V production
MFINVVLLVVLLSCVAMTYTEGLWGNAIRLVNVIAAALLATNFFEPLAGFLDSMLPGFNRYCDFVALWLLFGVFTIVFQTLTDQASRVKVRFLKMADQVGGIGLSLLIGWVLVCFTLMTLHTAPLAKHFLYDSFQARQRMFFGTAPDRTWLGFMRSMSEGPLCRSASAEERKSLANVFNADKQFIPRYEQRRGDLEAAITAENSPTGSPGK